MMTGKKESKKLEKMRYFSINTEKQTKCVIYIRLCIHFTSYIDSYRTR